MFTRVKKDANQIKTRSDIGHITVLATPKKSLIWEKQNLSTCADSSTDADAEWKTLLVTVVIFDFVGGEVQGGARI